MKKTYGFLVVSLNFDICVRGKIGHDDIFQLLKIDGSVSARRLDVEVECVEIGRSNNEPKVSCIVGVELERIWGSLRARPEGGAAGGDRVLGEVVQKLLDLVCKLRLKENTGPCNTILKSARSLCCQIVADRLKGFLVVTALLERSFNEVGLRQVQVDGLGGLDEELFKHVLLGPGNRVLNLVGEASNGTHGEFFLGRILRRGVRLCQVGQDNLCVALGTQSSALEQRLSEEDASSVDVGSRFDIVQSVGDTV